MMRAERPPRAVIEERAREGYRTRFPAGRQPAPPAVNVGAALLLLEDDSVRIPYRGRMYELGHVSFTDGLRLVAARSAVEALEDGEPTPENQTAYLQALRLVVRMAPRYLLPVKRVRRFFWRLRIRRNPFRNATDAEVGQFLGFFLGCRTRSRVQYPKPAASELAPIS